VVYNIIDKFWILPAIIKGTREVIWENRGEFPYLEDIWIKEKLLTEKGNLTFLGEETIECLDLFEYELRLVQSQVNEPRPETIPENYSLLRSGLAAYTEEFLLPYWRDIVKAQSFNKKEAKVLDYGGGAGQYAIEYRSLYPNSECFIADKADPKTEEDIEYIPVDFRYNPNWYHHWEERFDLILLNEVMHLGDELHDYLLQSSKEMLKPGGYLIVGEQLPNPRFNWRMAAYTENGRCLSPHELNEMARNNGLNPHFSSAINGSHYFSVLQK